jgi:hypothetical protein
VYLGPGGLLRATNSNITNNHAGLFGGGLGLGGGGNSDTCGVVLSECVLEGNTADHGGAQIYMACQGDMSLSSTQIPMGTGGSQVGCPTC